MSIGRVCNFLRRISIDAKMFHSSATQITACSKDEVKKFLDSFDTVLTDCDGVLWIDNVQITDASKVFNAFRAMGKKVFFITNNSTKVREDFVLKANNMGFIATNDDILSTAYLAANYLKNLGFTKKVYVIGSSGITKELDNVGIRHFGIGPDVLDTNVATFMKSDFKIDKEVGAVIVGFDEHISYPKLLKAATYLSNPECLFIGTNTDERFPMKTGYIIPGTGTMVRAVETCSERKALIMGKPDKYVADAISQRFDVDPKRTLMIGDRCNTDILLGTRCGFQTLLVLSGVTTLEEVKGWQKSDSHEEKQLIPDVYTQSIGDLLPYLI